MIRFLLCTSCKRAWTAPAMQPCDLCGNEPVSISPWAGERRVWLDVKIPDWRRAQIVEVAVYRDRHEQKQSIARAIVAKGNTTARLEVAC